MKRQIIVLFGVSLLTLGVLTGCGQKDENPGETGTEIISNEVTSQNATTAQNDAINETSTADNSTNIISEEEAKNIALQDAGVDAADVTNIRINLDYDDGRQEYDVDFYEGTKEYEYTISAEDGRILEKDIDNDIDF